MLAKWKAHKNFGYVFVLALLSFIMFLYITNVYLAWIVKMPLNFGKVIYLIIAHLMVFLFLWSFVQTLISDPGPVPLYWGFFLDDPEHKKRRYCLACHIFKPERCHHCSVCNRCVLNMDHHCPWVNNCIGFYNRKYFILMLFYVVLTSFVILCGQIQVEIVIIEEFSDFIENDGEFDWALNIFIIFGFIADVSIFFVILFFFKFHCTLIFNNLTTIEHLESKRSFSQTNYDIGFLYNFYQIFGKNWILWPFPIFLESGKPVGDGVVWLQRYKDTVVENNDNASDIASITNNNKKSDIAEDKLEKSKDEKPKRLGNNLDYSAHDKELSNSGYQQKNYNPYTTQVNSNKNPKIESSIDYNKYTNFDDKKYNIKADYTTDYNSKSKFDPTIPSINSYGLTSFSQPNYTNYTSIIKKNPNELPSSREDGGNKIASLNYDLYVGHHYNS